MKCQECNINDATITYTQTINGKTTTYKLCEDCAEKLGIGMNKNFGFDSFFDNDIFGDDFFDLGSTSFMNKMLSNFMGEKSILNLPNKQKCEQCGVSFDDIAKTGKLGCANDYYTFDEKLEPLINQIQGSTKHVGKSPKTVSNILNKEDGLNIEDAQSLRKMKITPNEKKEESLRLKQNLETKLQKAINLEDYEEAARLRDEIAKIKD